MATARRPPAAKYDVASGEVHILQAPAWSGLTDVADIHVDLVLNSLQAGDRLRPSPVGASGSPRPGVRPG